MRRSAWNSASGSLSSKVDTQNLAYALVQALHNVGAVAVVGGAVFGRWPERPAIETRRKLAWLILAGWMLQGVSGAGVGAISLAYEGELPDIHGIALAALRLKMACAAMGLVLAAGYLRYERGWSETRRAATWMGLIALGVTALTAAAFLRWFS